VDDQKVITNCYKISENLATTIDFIELNLLIINLTSNIHIKRADQLLYALTKIYKLQTSINIKDYSSNILLNCIIVLIYKMKHPSFSYKNNSYFINFYVSHV